MNSRLISCPPVEGHHHPSILSGELPTCSPPVSHYVRNSPKSGRRDGTAVAAFYVELAYGHSFLPAIVALRCQSNEAVWSSWGDGLAGTD